MERYRMKDGDGATRAGTGKLPHELMLEWAQTGLMEVPVRDAKGYYEKEPVVLSPSVRIKLAIACASYYAPKMLAQVPRNRDEERAAIKIDAAYVTAKILGPLRAKPAGMDKPGDDVELCPPQKPNG